MYRVRIKEIDGKQIVIGVAPCETDPVATARAIKADFEKSKEYQAFAGRIKKIGEYQQNVASQDGAAQRLLARAAQRMNKTVLLQDDLKDLTAQESAKLAGYAEIKSHTMQSIRAIQSELPEVSRNLKAKRVELMTENAIPFEPTADEVHVSDADGLTMIGKIAGLKDHEVLLLTGEVERDDRGRVAYLKDVNGRWNRQAVAMIGEPVDSMSIWQEDLADADRQEIATQDEADRIAGLNGGEKNDELAAVKDSLAAQAAIMRSKLEIQGSTAAKALKDSKEWYDAEASKADAKYA